MCHEKLCGGRRWKDAKFGTSRRPKGKYALNSVLTKLFVKIGQLEIQRPVEGMLYSESVEFKLLPGTLLYRL